MKQLLHLLGNVSPLMTALVSAPLTARALGPDGRGQVAVALLVATLVSVLGGFGVPWLARRFFAESGSVSVGVWFKRSVVASALTLPVAAGTWWVVSATSELSGVESASLALLLAASALSAVRGVQGNMLLAAGRSWLYGLHLLLASVVTLSLIVVFSMTGTLTVAATMDSTTVSILLAIATLFVFSRPLRAGAAVIPVPPLVPSRVVPVWMTQIMDFVLSRADIIVVALVASTSEVGIYSIAAVISVAMYAAATTVVQLSYAPTRWNWGKRRIANCVHICVAGGVIAAVACIPTMEFVYPTVFGAAFSSAADFIPSVAVMCLAAALIAPVIGLGSEGSKDYRALLTTLIVSFGVVALLRDVLPLPFLVAVLGALLAAGCATILVRSSSGEVLHVRPREAVAWLTGRSTD